MADASLPQASPVGGESPSRKNGAEGGSGDFSSKHTLPDKDQATAPSSRTQTQPQSAAGAESNGVAGSKSNSSSPSPAPLPVTAASPRTVGGGDQVKPAPPTIPPQMYPPSPRIQDSRDDAEDDDDDDDEDDNEDDWISDEGDESDIEDNVELAFPMRRRQSNPDLPETVTALETVHGCKVYVIGTAHFSVESQDDVSKVVQAVQPDVVMVELCKSRVNILELDEQMLLEEAKNINLDKVRMAVKQSGVVQGVMHLLLLSMSAHLTKQLGMAPGGEFRRAFQEARHVPGCRLQLGDRPIQITLKRALGALSAWQKLKLAWYLITTKDPISKEDVEKCKQRDLLEQLLKEMTGEFPALSQVFVEERDVYLTHSLKMAARPLDCPEAPGGYIPSVVVGVVGIGHVPGIIANWEKEQDIRDILTIPPGSIMGKVFRWSFRASLLCVLSYGCYRFYRWTSPFFL